jgi:hypothetical protein
MRTSKTLLVLPVVAALAGCVNLPKSSQELTAVADRHFDACYPIASQVVVDRVRGYFASCFKQETHHQTCFATGKNGASYSYYCGWSSNNSSHVEEIGQGTRVSGRVGNGYVLSADIDAKPASCTAVRLRAVGLWSNRLTNVDAAIKGEKVKC